MPQVKSFIILVITALLVYSFTISLRNYMRLTNLKKQYVKLEEKLNELTYQNQYYNNLLEVSDTKLFWELEAKQKVGYSQPNEVVFKFY